MSTNHWILYNPKNKTQTEPLTTDTAQMALLKMKTKEVTEFLIWQQGWKEWKKLDHFLKSDDNPFVSIPFSLAHDNENNQTSASSLQMRPADAHQIQQIQNSVSEIDLTETSTPKKAGHNQFDGYAINENTAGTSHLSFNNADFKKKSELEKYKIELLLMDAAGNLFRTTTTHLTLSGCYSEKNIPNNFQHNMFDLILINNFISDEQYKKVMLKGKIQITDSNLYIEFIFENESKKSQAKSLLEHYSRSIAKLK